MGATAGSKRQQSRGVCVGGGGGLPFLKRSAVLAARPVQRQVAMEPEKQDDMTLSATGRSKWEIPLTYPVPPVASIVALTL